MNEAEDTFHLGIKALIRNPAGKVLLLKVNTKKLRGTTDAYWDIPGGRVQRNSTAEDTLRREVEEEIGVLDIHDVKPFSMVLSNIRIPLEPLDVGLVLAIYTCSIDTKIPLRLSEEHTEAGWFDIAEAATLLQVKYPRSFTQELQKLAFDLVQ